MNWTFYRHAAIAVAACVSAFSAAAVGAAHSRRHQSHSHKQISSHKKPSASRPTKPSTKAAAVASTPAATVSVGVIDRASHDRAPFPVGDPTPTRGENIARTALAYRGVPYRFGGRSAQSGFDCSGLVQTVCAKWGIYLPRVAGAQFARGIPVKPWELRPGDLVFFQGTYKRGLSHVGIYIGEGKFVHAAGRGKGVRISELSDSYNQKHWAGARRLDLAQLPKSRKEAPIVPAQVVVDAPERPAEHSETPSPRPVASSGAEPGGQGASSTQPAPR